MNKHTGKHEAVQLASLMAMSCLALTGCGMLRVPASPPKAEVRELHVRTNAVPGAVSIDILQAQVMRFADVYATTIAQASDDLAEQLTTPQARLEALRWKLSQATSAFIDASGPNPNLNALDILVLVTLSRIVAEDHQLEVFGDAALPLVESHRTLETEAWMLARPAIKPPQQQELRDMIQEWRRKNPNQNYIGAIRFREFAAALGKVPKPGTAPAGSIFGLLFLDPFAGLDPTAAAIEETRLLGERAMYYSQRMPMLLSWQTEMLAYQLASQPESRQVLSNAQRLVDSSEVFARTANQLPALVDQQREAAIRQVFQELALQEKDVRGILTDTRETLNAGTAMAVSVNTAVQSLDTLTRRVSSGTNGPRSTLAAKPFDVLEYAQTADRVGAAARDLNDLLASLNSNVPQLRLLSAQATADADRVVRHGAWWGFGLIAALLAASIIASIAYRFITKRWPGERLTRPSPGPNGETPKQSDSQDEPHSSTRNFTI